MKENELPARQAARYQNLSEKLVAASREVSDPVWKNESWPLGDAATSGACNDVSVFTVTLFSGYHTFR